MVLRARFVVAAAAVGAVILSTSIVRLPIAPLVFAADKPEKPAAEAQPSAKEDDDLSFEEKIYKALERPIDARFDETPLVDVANYFKTELKVPVVLDQHALEALEVKPDTPVTLDQRDISAQAALRLILRPLGLTYTVRREALTITTPADADCNLTLRVYDVADLVAAEAGEEADQQPLDRYTVVINLITSCCAPTTWDDVGGPGAICAIDAAGIHAVVVCQTQAVHEEVEGMLKILRSARHGEPPVKFRTRPVGSVTAEERAASKGKDMSTTEREAAVLAKLDKLLDQRLEGKAEKFPLSSAVAYLKDHAKLPVEVDKKALEEISISVNTEVTLELDGRRLRIALTEMLRPIGLTWLIQDEVILITTPEEADARLVTVVYDVTDLPAYRLPNGKVSPPYDALMKLISATVAPTTWGDVGGPGSMGSFHRGGIQALVISQTPAVHQEIVDILAMLRKLRGHSPTKEELDALPPPPPPKKKPEEQNSGAAGMGGMGGGLFF